MSEARAGRLPYTGVPDVRTGFAPTEYQRIPTSPEMFGAQIGQGLEALGQGMAKASDLYSEIAAQQAATNWHDQVNKVLFGDPNKPGDVGFYGLQGQAAMEARQGTLQQIDAITQQTLGSLGTTRSQLTFNNESRYYRSRIEQEIGIHYARQSEVWAGEVNKAQGENALADAGLRYNSDAAANDAYAKQTEANTRLMISQGQIAPNMADAKPEELEMLRAKNRQSLSDNYLIRVRSAIGHNDWTEADRIFAEGKPILATSPHFDALAAEMAHHAKMGQAMALAFGGQLPPATSVAQASRGSSGYGGNLIPGGAAAAGTQAPESLVQDIWRTEGSKDSDVSPKGAIGHGQITPGTARQYGFDPSRLHDRDYNDMVSRTIINKLWEHYGDPTAVKVAYNAGPGTADKWLASGRNPNVLLPETRNYIGAGGGASAEDHQVPGLAPQIDRIVAQGTAAGQDPAVITAAIQLRRESDNAAWTDQERARTLDRQARQDASDKTEAAIVADAYSGRPQITAQQISQMPESVLSPQAKIRMMQWVRKATEPGDPIASRQETIALLGDIRRQPGDSQRITDMGPIYDAFTQGKLTKEDFSFLQKQFTDFRGDDGQKLLTTEGEFIKGMQSSITKSNAIMGKIDHEGDPKFYAFHWMVDNKIDEYRKAGKNPFDLFNPSKPDYLGSPQAMRPYMTSLQESTETLTRNLTGAPAPAAPTAAPATPLVTQRKPGESMSDWVARTHQGLPGAPAAGPPLEALPPSVHKVGVPGSEGDQPGAPPPHFGGSEPAVNPDLGPAGGPIGAPREPPAKIIGGGPESGR